MEPTKRRTNNGMKIHVMNEAKPCLACGVMHRLPHDYCLACHIETVSHNAPHFALPHRYFKMQEYHGPSLVQHLQGFAHLPTNSFFYDIQDSSIKLCEQIRKEVLASTLPAGYSAKLSVNNPLDDGAAPCVKSYRLWRAQLATKLLTKQRGRCAYCRTAIEHAALDMMLSLHIDHGRQVARACCKEFRELTSQAGLQVAICHECNAKKTSRDLAGITTWQRLLMGHRKFLPLETCRPRSGIRNPRRYLSIHSPGGQETIATAAEYNQAAAMVPLMSMRIASTCTHLQEPRVYAGWAWRINTLYFGCDDCIKGTDLVALVPLKNPASNSKCRNTTLPCPPTEHPTGQGDHAEHLRTANETEEGIALPPDGATLGKATNQDETDEELRDLERQLAARRLGQQASNETNAAGRRPKHPRPLQQPTGSSGDAAGERQSPQSGSSASAVNTSTTSEQPQPN